MKKCIFLLLLLALLTGCSLPWSDVQKQDHTVYAMDTVMTLTAYGDNAETALSAAEAEIYRLDALLSISNANSDIYHLNQAKSAEVDLETGALLQRALELATLTDGDFDPTVFPLTVLWGFYSQDGTYNYHIPTDQERETVLQHVGYEKLLVEADAAEDSTGTVAATLTDSEAGVDLGGIAKGYTAQRVLSVLETAGVDSAVISLGGNVGTLGRKPDGSLWTVAVEDPAQRGEYLATLSLDGGYYAITSGAYQRYFEENGVRYHHILDPETGAPADTDLQSVTIVSKDGTQADALSTALFVKGFDEAVDFWRAHADAFEMVLVTDTELYATSGLTISSQRTVHTLEVEP